MAAIHDLYASLYPINALAIRLTLLATPVRYATKDIYTALLAHQAVGIKYLHLTTLLRLQHKLVIVIAQRSPLAIRILIIVFNLFFFNGLIQNSHSSTLQLSAQQSRNVLWLHLRR